MNVTKRIIRKSNFWANLFKTPGNKTDLEEVLHAMPPFRGFDAKHLKIFMKLIHNRVYEPNEYIFYQGDPGICLYLIREGEILISQIDEDNREYELGHFTRGDFFGELALLDSEFRSASAIALRETQIAVIFKPDLDEFIEKYPKQGIAILRGISQIIATRLKSVNQDYMFCYRKLLKIEKEHQNEKDQIHIGTD